MHDIGMLLWLFTLRGIGGPKASRDVPCLCSRTARSHVSQSHALSNSSFLPYTLHLLQDGSLGNGNSDARSMTSEKVMNMLGQSPPCASYKSLRTLAAMEADLDRIFESCTSQDEIKAGHEQLKAPKQAIGELLVMLKQATKDAKGAWTAARTRMNAGAAQPRKPALSSTKASGLQKWNAAEAFKASFLPCLGVWESGTRKTSRGRELCRDKCHSVSELRARST